MSHSTEFSARAVHHATNGKGDPENDTFSPPLPPEDTPQSPVGPNTAQDTDNNGLIQFQPVQSRTEAVEGGTTPPLNVEDLPATVEADPPPPMPSDVPASLNPMLAWLFQWVNSMRPTLQAVLTGAVLAGVTALYQVFVEGKPLSYQVLVAAFVGGFFNYIISWLRNLKTQQVEQKFKVAQARNAHLSTKLNESLYQNRALKSRLTVKK